MPEYRTHGSRTVLRCRLIALYGVFSGNFYVSSRFSHSMKWLRTFSVKCIT